MGQINSRNLDMLILHDVYLNHGCDPNIKRGELMKMLWLLNRTHMDSILEKKLFVYS
ncbi:MAG: hypothetical protein DIAAKJNI_00081 [Candidatus Argoarchaeum ethanivorans]|uniref:Uncharacterized protein n=1 Tax=Candidatus Argoarchaeum ethanivorans TaxID=2608793 RepID=A0A811T9Q7_9EURY|nr:MAG: hypothetical protein DIAAKJNI_00081 [Candidatus Argoarchaeum ethanivorans]